MKRLHRDSKYFAAITPPALDIFPWDVFISGRSAGFEASLSTDSKGNDERSDGIQEGIFRYYPLLWYFAVVAAVATKGLVRYIRYGVTWTTSGRMDHFPKSIPQVWMMKHRVGSWTGRCHTANRVGRGGGKGDRKIGLWFQRIGGGELVIFLFELCWDWKMLLGPRSWRLESNGFRWTR